MKRLRWQLLVVVLALVAIAGLLVTQQNDVVLPGIIQATQPATGGQYSEALIGSPSRFNPLLAYYNPVDHDVSRLVFSGLLRFDHRGVPQGDLAESWGISADGNAYNFLIHENAVFHDGEPVTSADIAFTVGLMQDDATPIPQDLRDFWQQVEVVEIDDRTIQFRLPEAFAPFMDYLTFGVLPVHLLEGVSAEELVDASFNLEPVGSGPYRFDHLLVQDGQIQGVALAAFEDYYADPPHVTELTFLYYPDARAALDAYRAGEVMGISLVTADILPEVLTEPDLNLYTGRLPQLTLVYFNLDNAELPFLQDPEVRRALLAGLNRQWIVDRALNGQAFVADGPIFPGTWAYYEGIERIAYDPDLALNTLKKAGYTIPAEGGSVRAKDGVRLSFELVHPDEEPYISVAQAIQRYWAELGVELALLPVPYEELVNEYLEPRTYEAALVDLSMARSPDPDPYPFWHQAQATGGQNYARWDDRRASEYLEQARVLVDANERIKRYRNFQVRFTSEMPALPLYYPVYSYAVDNEVLGLSMGPLFDPSDRLNTITQWYTDVERVAASAAGTEGAESTQSVESTESTESPPETAAP